MTADDIVGKLATLRTQLEHLDRIPKASFGNVLDLLLAAETDAGDGSPGSGEGGA
jgi:hypothetical protein